MPDALFMLIIVGILSISIFSQGEASILVPNVFAQDYEIPTWIKNNAGWWATDQIDDSSFLQGIQYLIKERIMVIPTTEISTSSGSQEVPSWIKNNAGWWADGQIDDGSFVLGLQWLITNGIIIVEEKMIHTDTNLRVAFIGDQSISEGAIAVLNLIKDEGADMVLHQGDLDYIDDPDAWDSMISNILGDDFPYFATPGGHEFRPLGVHDDTKWDQYQLILQDRLDKIPDAECIGDLGIKSSCTYKGLFFTLSSPGLKGTGHGAFIENQLNNNDHTWRICTWERTTALMQVVIKGDLDNWEVYENCKDGGAIIATGHAHSYSRTKTLTDIENQIIDKEWSEPNNLRVKEGATFVFVSALGGHPNLAKDIPIQTRCLPTTYPYGCNEEWASIYTASQDANHGALFCTFNVDGQPNKAYCYFKNIDGKIIDEFTVTSFVGISSDNTSLADVDEKIIHTDIDSRVAFIAEQSLSPDAIAVLNLIKDEGADMVLHQGDFDNKDDPALWDKTISNVLGDDFPYFATPGGSDIAKWDQYQRTLQDRLNKIPDAECIGDLGIKSSCTYKGLFFILASPGIPLLDRDVSGYDSFIENQLNNNDHTWRICAWERTTISMQVADKGGFDNWEVYENCKDGGAIIATGHAHSYSRTKTLTDIENQIIDKEWSEPNNLRVKEGATFVFVSAIGGESINSQTRCLPTTYPYGCNEEWASIYTASQDANHGALFCTFNVDGQPNKAYCYFKNIDGKIIDEFTVTSFVGISSDNTSLADVDMSGMDLTGKDFSNKMITHTNLSNAILIGANLSNVVFIGTTLTGADLTDANLTGVSLAYKDLTGTILRGTDLTDASLTGVDLSYKDLTGTILRGVDLSDTNLTGIDLSGRDLTGTILRGMDLSDKDLTGTILTGADLSDTNLTGVDLSGRDLTGVNFTRVDLSNKNLSNSILTYSTFDNTDLSNANLTNVAVLAVDLTKIKNKSLVGTILERASFAHSNLSGVNLSGTTMKGTNFLDTNLTGVDFTVVKNLNYGNIFQDANLTNSNFEGIDLSPKHVFTKTFPDKAELTNLNFDEMTRELFPGIMPVHIISKKVVENDLELVFVLYHSFALADLKNANLKNTVLWFGLFYNSDLSNADLSGADLSRANLDGADLKNANLDGVTVDGTVLTCKNHLICQR